MGIIPDRGIDLKSKKADTNKKEYSPGGLKEMLATREVLISLENLADSEKQKTSMTIPMLKTIVYEFLKKEAAEGTFGEEFISKTEEEIVHLLISDSFRKDVEKGVNLTCSKYPRIRDCGSCPWLLLYDGEESNKCLIAEAFDWYSFLEKSLPEEHSKNLKLLTVDDLSTASKGILHNILRSNITIDLAKAMLREKLDKMAISGLESEL